MQRPLVFANDRLVGVLTEPTTDAGDRPCVIVLNAGLIYRAGPGRLSVEIARRVARTGFPCFRFDLSGIGDSDPRAESLSSNDNAVADTKEAMDALEASFGFKRFVLCGLCSGATHSHFIATADPRVIGAIQLDGYIFQSRRSSMLKKVQKVRPLRQLPSRAMRWAFRQPTADPVSPALAEPDEGGILPNWPEREPIEEGLKILRERGVPLLQLYTGEWDDYCFVGQHAEAFASLGYGALLTERRIPTAEHLFLMRSERGELLATIAEWLDGEPWLAGQS